MTCDCVDPVVFGCHCGDRPTFATGETFTVTGWAPYTTICEPITRPTPQYITTTGPVTIHFTEVPAPPGG